MNSVKGPLLKALNRLLGTVKLELRRTSDSRGEYTVCEPYGYRTYSPWLEESFDQEHGSASLRTLVTSDRRYVLQRFAEQALHLVGDFAECGVYRGGTAYLLARVLSASPKSLHLFDTFSGMPDAAAADPSGHVVGDFGDTSLDSVKALLAPFAGVVCHRGVIPETFRDIAPDARFALVHLDVDLYQSVRDGLEFFYPRLVPGGIVVVDDYGFEMYREAARRAVDEFFAAKREKPLVLRTGQCVVVRL